MPFLCPPDRARNVYDPRLRDLVFHTGDVTIAHTCGVPRSTRNDWKNGKFRDGVVTLDVFDRDMADLQAEVLKLQRRLRVCGALVGLLVVLVKAFGLRLVDHQRLPEGFSGGQLEIHFAAAARSTCCVSARNS